MKKIKDMRKSKILPRFRIGFGKIEKGGSVGWLK